MIERTTRGLILHPLMEAIKDPTKQIFTQRLTEKINVAIMSSYPK